MMDREALAAALEAAIDYPKSIDGTHWETILATLEKHLAQLPETCGTCNGTGEWRSAGFADATRFAGWYPCDDCTNGYLYPPALVERIATALFFHDHPRSSWQALDHDLSRPDGLRAKYLSRAVAVLDALNTETE